MFDSLSDWLASITWPLVTRVFTALGFGTVTYQGASTALNQAFDSASSSISGLAGPVMQLMAMAGFFDVLSITSGGLASGLAFMVMKRFALQSGT